MKVTGIIGSRRKNGNTSTLMKETLKPLIKGGFDTEIIFLGDYNIKSCTGCEGCSKTYKCIIKDDMHKVYKLILESDILILGSPTYFYNVSGDMKTFIDRLYCYEFFNKEDRAVWMGLGEVMGGRYAAVIAVCEQHSEDDMGFTAAAMEKPLNALGYRVIDTVKSIGLFKAEQASKNETELLKAKCAGEKILKTIELRKKLQQEFTPQRF
jgi:multimeric flavodoxin WrbA